MDDQQEFFDASLAAYNRDAPSGLSPLLTPLGTPLKQANDADGFFAEAFKDQQGRVIELVPGNWTGS